ASTIIRKIVELRLPAMAIVKSARQITAIASRLGVVMLIKAREIIGQRWLPIGENRFATAPGQRLTRQSLQFFRILLVGPKKHAARPRPQFDERILCLKYSGRVGKLCPIPQISARFVQNT